MFSKVAQAGLLALAATTLGTSVAQAGSPYDGRWSLTIHTTRGDCSTYNLPVDISNGYVSFPNLVHANGRVTPKGHVRVFVTAMGKSANGSGKLTSSSGSGRWTGRSAQDRCSGVWTAQRG